MNEIVRTTNQTPIEVLLRIDEDGTVSARNVYGFLELADGQFSRWAKNNIIENGFAVEDEDYWGFDIIVEGNPTTDYKLSVPFAKKLCMKQGNIRGEQARDYFVKVEEAHKETRLALSNLSPQLQLLIRLETAQKQQAQQIDDTNKRIDNIGEIVALNPVSWRDETQQLIKRIADALGGIEHVRDVHSEVYELVEIRAGCNLMLRLTNKRRRMADEGVSKTRRDKLNRLDAIADDKKLIEIYIAIVKEMSVKYLGHSAK